MKCNLELMKREIAAMLPAAHPDGGEATLLVTVKNISYLDRRSTGWILKRLACLHNIDLHAVKGNYGGMLGRERYLPVPLSRTVIFLPVAFKTNTITSPRRLGYVSLLEIAAVKKEKESALLILKSGLELHCSNSVKTIEKRCREGELLQKILLIEQMEDIKVPPLFQSGPPAGERVMEKDSGRGFAGMTAGFPLKSIKAFYLKVDPRFFKDPD